MDTKPAPVSAVPALADRAIANAIDQATANLIARVNVVGVTVDDLLLAAAEIQKLPLETRGATSLYCTTLRLADLQGNGGQCSVGSDGGDSQVGEDTALGLAQHNL